jgi:hypothetical protein
MLNKRIIQATLILGMLSLAVTTIAKTGADFSAIVKLIESFYHVKHKSLPLTARVGIKAAKTAGRIAGVPKEPLMEAGSVKLATFEDQDFRAEQSVVELRRSMKNLLEPEWSSLVQALSSKGEEQNYIYIKDSGEKFHVLVVNIGPRDATVIQADISPKHLALLMRDPSEMGKTLTDEANSEP